MDTLTVFTEGWRELAAPVTLLLKRPASPMFEEEKTVTVPNCHEEYAAVRMGMDGEEMALDEERRSFTLWQQFCEDVIPAEDFVISRQDAPAVLWLIKEVETQGHGARFRCHCMRSRGNG